MQLESVAILVDDYDEAIVFFVEALGFELTEGTPSSATATLLARADGERQSAGVDDQAAGRVGFFLRVDDLHASSSRMVEHRVRFLSEPRVRSCGTVAVFLDVAGTKWDVLG